MPKPEGVDPVQVFADGAVTIATHLAGIEPPVDAERVRALAEAVFSLERAAAMAFELSARTAPPTDDGIREAAADFAGVLVGMYGDFIAAGPESSIAQRFARRIKTVLDAHNVDVPS